MSDIFAEWKYWQDHNETVLEVLRKHKCIDSKGRIRAWRPGVKSDMVLCGHTSLDYAACACRKHKMIETVGDA